MHDGHDAIAIALPERLQESAARNGVPGASVTVLLDGQVYSAASGLVEVGQPASVTPDTVFRIGSVTKVFTATIAMMLVGEQKLGLDDHIEKFLPQLVRRNRATYGDVHVRQLLSHTSGIDGDRLTDTGDGDDAIAKYVEELGQAAKLHAAGQFLSYCNAGFNILGRIIEVIEGKSWPAILQDRLLEPLGLDSATMSAEDDSPIAKGHELNAEGEYVAIEQAFVPRSNGPSGTTLAMTGRDLMKFVGFHLNEGVTADGRRLLSAQLVRDMQGCQVTTPHSNRYTGWGIGLMLFGSDSNRVYGHDGGWAGQSTYLRVAPASGFAVSIMANGGSTARLFRDIAGQLLAEYANFAVPVPPRIEETFRGDIAAYEGCYERFGQTIELHADRSSLTGTLSGPYSGERPTSISVTPVNHANAVCEIEGIPDKIEAYFLEFDARKRPQFLHVTERAFRRREAE